jgi:transposase
MASFPSSRAPSRPGGPDDPAAPGDAPASGIREKLSLEQIALMRDWVEQTACSYRRIGQELGISPSTISRYAAEGGWKRPDRAALPPVILRPNPAPLRPHKSAPARAGDRREQIVDRLWTLAERHAEILETQPIERAERALQPLARLTRTLGEMDKHIRPPSSPEDDVPDINKPQGRNLHELRAELQAHLDRIMQEEGYGWEVREWWFEDGAGI